MKNLKAMCNSYGIETIYDKTIQFFDVTIEENREKDNKDVSNQKTHQPKDKTANDLTDSPYNIAAVLNEKIDDIIDQLNNTTDEKGVNDQKRKQMNQPNDVIDQRNSITDDKNVPNQKTQIDPPTDITDEKHVLKKQQNDVITNLNSNTTSQISFILNEPSKMYNYNNNIDLSINSISNIPIIIAEPDDVTLPSNDISINHVNDNIITENVVEIKENIVVDTTIASNEINIDLLDSIVFENSSHTNNELFNQEIKFSSTTDSFNINASTPTRPEIMEYEIIRNRIQDNKDVNVVIPSSEMLSSPLKNVKSSNVYVQYEAEIIFSPRETLFLKELFHRANNRDKMVAFLEDLLREKFKIFKQKCPIVYTSSVWNKSKTTLFLYARCIYSKNGCGRYRFAIVFKEDNIYGKIDSNGAEFNHPVTLKRQQIRSIRRIIAKHELRHEKASNWRDRKLCQQQKKLRSLGNDQEIPTRDTARKIKSEELRSLQRDNDIFIDLYKMQIDKNWKNFIQNISNPMEVYLFSKQQLKLLEQNKKKILQLSRNTLFFDATGNIVRKFESTSKHTFLYSLVAHIQENKERGILIPIAEALLCNHFSEDIERFLLYIKVFCSKNSLTWPICKRICVDWSYALINAVVRVFNKDYNIHNLEQYIATTYMIYKNKLTKINIVVIQICCAHFLRTVYKDIEKYYQTAETLDFFKWQFVVAVNICEVDEFFKWVRNILTVCLNKYYNSQVMQSISAINKYDKNIKIEPTDEHLNKTIKKQKIPNYKKSPYYLKTLSIFNEIRKIEQTSAECNKYFNENFALLILNKYSAYTPLWTNIMGKFVDKKNTRISNNAVESYFNVTKNVTLEGRSNLIPSDYVRRSYTYVKAKMNDAENIYLGEAISKQNKRKIIKLEEETWMRTPKKSKAKMNPTLAYENICNKFKLLPRSLKDKRYIIFSYRNLYKNRQVSYPLTIDLSEFNSLNPKQCLYNNIVDIYINILITQSEKSAYALSTEEGKNLFYSENYIDIPIDQFCHIFVPIIHNNHYTLVYLDIKKKVFYFFDSLKKINSNDMFEKFEKYINDKTWKNYNIEYDGQNDCFNCGVFICQYVEALLQENSPTNLRNPNIYRIDIKNKLEEYADDMKEICIHCGDVASTSKNVCTECSRPSCVGCTQFYYKEQNFSIEQKCIFCKSKKNE